MSKLGKQEAERLTAALAVSGTTYEQVAALRATLTPLLERLVGGNWPEIAERAAGAIGGDAGTRERLLALHMNATFNADERVLDDLWRLATHLNEVREI
jgi:hypothetical protein